MASLQASTFVHSSFSPLPSLSKKKGTIIKATLDFQRSRTYTDISLHNLQAGSLSNELELARDFQPFTTSFVEEHANSIIQHGEPDPLVMEKLYAILEMVSDRVEMHKNIGQQRENWNSLLLTSINSITLAATTISGIASTMAVHGGAPLTALKLSSTLMFLAATGMLLAVNKIQPSQLAEEQRNAARMFQNLHNQIKTMIVSKRNPSESYVEEAMEKVLSLDKAYPLPLLGVMLEKFPSRVEPAVWWPKPDCSKDHRADDPCSKSNGWNPVLEQEMKSIVEVIRRKDKAEYIRLGEKALKLNKALAVTGPLLTGLAAVGSAFVGCHSYFGTLAAMAGVVGGALASVVNSVEHGGQVGMVFEMYRSNAGFFKLMEESIESNLVDKRENGELFELKTALQLGRSLSELRSVACFSSSCSKTEEGSVDQFASKLF